MSPESPIAPQRPRKRLARGRWLPGALLALLLTSLGFAQPWNRGGWGGGWGGRERRKSRSDFPTWEIKEGFSRDTFQFTRIKYASGRGYGQNTRWDNDYPDSDLNFSYRLQELTAIEVEPNPEAIDLTDPNLFDSPFAYMVAPGLIVLSDEEVGNLRRFLLNGGFLMMDDFWGTFHKANILAEMRRVLPEVEPRELPLDHSLFQLVMPLAALPQVPDILAWRRGYDYEARHPGIEEDHAPHFLGYFNEKGHLMALLCHNNDLGDGWEREGHEVEYFQRFSEKWSYPFGINAITYALTH